MIMLIYYGIIFRNSNHFIIYCDVKSELIFLKRIYIINICKLKIDFFNV